MNKTTFDQTMLEMNDRCNNATAGPWLEAVIDAYSSLHDKNVTFIAHSRTDLPRVLRALRIAVEAIEHQMDREVSLARIYHILGHSENLRGLP